MTTAAPVVYLDHAATTPLRPEALEAMLPFLRERFGNPSGSHAVARAAKQAVEEARDDVAAALGCEPAEVVFTSGGTEADNLAVAGVVRACGGTAACPAVEHHAVLHAVEAVGGRVTPVQPDGAVDLVALGAAVDADVSVVSVQLVNNETGVVQDLHAVAAALDGRAVLHTDAVQAVTWLDVAAASAPAQLVSVAAHKHGGPQGVGALVVRRGTPLAPILHGGGQEAERRSGTHNVAGVVGMAAALRATVAERAAVVARVGARRDRLVERITARLDGVAETVARHRKVAGNAHLLVDGVESEALLVLLDDAGICASAGSACASGAVEPSHVLLAMGIDRERALGALRLTLGPGTTEREVDRAADAVVSVVRRLRGR